MGSQIGDCQLRAQEKLEKSFQVIIIGSGFGGQCAAIRLKSMNINDFLILERSPFAGGTWCQNTYPGAAVDVQSPLYSIESEPYDWLRLFASQSELKAYTDHILHKHDLAKNICLNMCVKRLTWKESDNRWEIEAGDDTTYLAQFVINAVGPLSQPIIPDFVGQDQFKGRSFHTNQWDHDFDHAGKRVAIVGSGASAAQIIPAIASDVESLDIFQRTPHWVLPRPDFEFKPWHRRVLKNRIVGKVLRGAIYWGLETRVIGFKYSSVLRNLFAQKPALRLIKKQIKDPQLRRKVTPDYAIGCKRVILSNTLYPAYQLEGVKLHSAEDGVKRLTESGIVTAAGEHIELDLIVYSTGYDATDGIITYPIIGRDGRSLADFWHDYPRAYLGTTLPSFPNLFIIIGPNTSTGHTSALLVIEAQMDYITNSIAAVIDQGKETIEVTADAEAAYTRRIHKEMKKTVWITGGCSSWYQSKSRRITGIFPGFSFTFKRWAKNLKLRDHQIG